MTTIDTLHAGTDLKTATAVMVMLHGRGASAHDILTLSQEFMVPGIAYLAPQAPGGSWYPNRFTAPIQSNQPYLNNALATVLALMSHLADAGFGSERTVLLGFSQGACLALEYAARNARRYGAVVALSGGLIGPPGTDFSYPGTLDGTPVFLGCSDVDSHIPLARVQESSAALRTLGGAVTERIYPGMDHTVNQDELAFVQELIEAI